MRMIDLGSQRGPLNLHMHMKLMDTPTSIDCGREVRFRRSFRSLMECVVPSCCGLQPPSSDSPPGDAADQSITNTTTTQAAASSSSSRVTGTFFGYRKGRVSFCIQEGSRASSSHPLLLLEFGVPTAFLAREMQHGLLRIALVECGGSQYRHKSSDHDQQGGFHHHYYHSANSSSSKSQTIRRYYGSSSLLKVPVWCMYCNGRKVGFATRRELTVGDLGVLKLMQSVSVGAGVLPASEATDGTGGESGDLLMYLRASFQRVIGSADSQSFHMINPDNVESSGQELSVFLLRSS